MPLSSWSERIEERLAAIERRLSALEAAIGTVEDMDAVQEQVRQAVELLARPDTDAAAASS